jgi:hypothetical protein
VDAGQTGGRGVDAGQVDAGWTRGVVDAGRWTRDGGRGTVDAGWTRGGRGTDETGPTESSLRRKTARWQPLKCAHIEGGQDISIPEENSIKPGSCSLQREFISKREDSCVKGAEQIRILRGGQGNGALGAGGRR